MAFVRILTQLLKDKNIGSHVVPIVPDEARTFGMEGLFRQVGIYSSVGQLYTPQDADQLMYYREDSKGQILEEGINEAGAFCSWMAAGTAYANHGINMIPLYIFYSMFGFQRIGDFAWAAGDMQARGFLLGATAGRTTLAGEGLQHQDGHSHLLASTIPNCVAYDPCFAYELAVIMQDGLRRMYAEQESVFYYITCMNENYAHPAMPKGVEQGILRGMYLLHIGGRGTVRATLLGSGTILREVLAAAELLESEFGIPADVFSVTSFSELRRDALAAEREAMLTPGREAAQALGARMPRGPRGTVRRGDRLHEDRRRPDPPVGAGPLRRARHRRLRPQRLARSAARALRGRTGTGSSSRRSRRSPTTASIDTRERHARDEEVRHRPGQAGPAGELKRDDGRAHHRQSCPTSATSPTSRSSRCWSRPATRSPSTAPLITLETDKATMDVPSTAAGRVAEVSVKKGDRVSKGSRDRRARVRRRARGDEGIARPAATGSRPRRWRPQPRRPQNSRSACRTSATSRTSRSSRCW